MNKKIGIGIGVFVVIVAAILAYVISRPAKQTAAPTQQQQSASDVIPTVGASTTVDLKPVQSNKEVVLTVNGIPQNTSSVDYELSYQTKAEGTQGVIGTITTFANDTFDKQITLGTCSSGKCVYHEVVGAIHVTIKFTGDYGEKVLEKDFTL